MILKKSNNDYLTKKEKLIFFTKIYIMFFIISFIFYKKILLAFIFAFLSLMLFNELLYEKNKKIEEKIIEKFNEFINIFDSYISSGDEPNFAFCQAYDEYKDLCNNKILLDGLSKTCNYISVYNDFLKAMEYFKNQMNIKIIDKFYDSINVAYSSLGDINHILKSTIEVISDKIVLSKEIENIYHEKRYELKIMLFMPVLIFEILSLTAKEFINPMYNNITGYIIITVCIVMLICAYLIGEYIMRIDLE